MINNNSSLQKFGKSQISIEILVLVCDHKYYKVLQDKLVRTPGTKMCIVCIDSVKQKSEAFYRYILSINNADLKQILDRARE